MEIQQGRNVFGKIQEKLLAEIPQQKGLQAFHPVFLINLQNSVHGDEY